MHSVISERDSKRFRNNEIKGVMELLEGDLKLASEELTVRP